MGQRDSHRGKELEFPASLGLISFPGPGPEAEAEAEAGVELLVELAALLGEGTSRE